MNNPAVPESHRDALIAEARAKTRSEGITFDPKAYASDEDMMAAAEALLMQWWNEAPDVDQA